VDRIMNMKITEKFNLDIMGEARAVIYGPGDDMWSKVSLPSMAIGYQSLLTPLHTLAFYNAIANDGTLMRPYFIENIEKDGTTEIEFGPRQVSGSICSSSTIDQLKSALRGVVEEGTGKIIEDPRYSISGKTGTARIAFDGRYVDAAGYRKHQASFAGFFPSEKPEYSAIVVLYSVKTRGNFYGGSWAAPVFKKIADKIYAKSTGWSEPIDRPKVIPSDSIPVLAGNIAETSGILSFLPVEKKSNNSASGKWTSPEANPDVVGMGLKDALFVLENRGYHVRHTGRGVVVSQQLLPNTRGGKRTIEIKLEPDHATKTTYTRY
jgi:cell division protein FtsI (penicillin-binding protein 3)